MPTAGHKAIANLVRRGYVRVIVTTNFDRLLENALREVGVEPTVVGSPDALNGAEPLIHSSCYVLKLHGDYKDERILNTDIELEAYPASYDTLLDRIIDEHGLIVCGWSGEWDYALRSAILRAPPNRRYPMFWATRGELRGRGAELCRARKGVTVPITDADSFFVKLTEQLETLAQSQQQNPLSVAMTVSRAKRYLAKLEYRIQLADLVAEEVDRIIERHDRDDLAVSGQFVAENFQQRVALYESLSEGGLAKVCGLIGRWGGNDAQLRTVIDALKGLLRFSTGPENGLVVNLKMRKYPAVLAYQACALGLQSAERWQTLHDFMSFEIENGHGGPSRLLDEVGPSTWDGPENGIWQSMPGMDQRSMPFLDHLVQGPFGTWCRSFLPPRASVSDAWTFADWLTAICYLESIEKAHLSDVLSKSEHDKNYLWAPTGLGGNSFRRMYHDNKPKNLDSEEFVRMLAESGFGRGDPEVIKMAIESQKGI